MFGKKKEQKIETGGVTYRRAKTWQIALASCSSGIGMSFYVLLGLASYVANEGYGIATAVVGLILTATRILDGVTDPIIAIIIDKMNTKFGKIRILTALGWAIESLAVLMVYCWASGKGHGIVEVEHVLPAAGQQAADRAAHGRALVAAHGVEVLPGERAAQQHHRHLLGGAADVGVARLLALHKVRAHKDQPIHALGQQQGEVFFLGLLLIARAAQQAVVAALAQAALQVVDGLGEVGVRGVRAEQADGVHGVQPQAPRKGVGRIAVLLDDAQHLLPRARADAVAAVDHAGDRGDRHARQLRDVVDVQPFRPLFSVM